MARAVAALLSLGIVLAGRPGQADHEVYYRYVVLGFVKDARGAAVVREEVRLTRDKTGLTYLDETDERGFFLLIARFGDEGLGETLTLSIGGRTTPLTVDFDPANREDERGTRVDFEGTRFVERRAWFQSTLAAALAAPARERRE